METVRFNDFKKEANKRKVKKLIDDGKRFAMNVGRWCAEHPAETIAIATLTVGVIKKGCTAYAAHAEDVRRILDIYDPRTGDHCIVKRALTAAEKLMLNERYRAGEDKVKILFEMGLLRR